MTHTAFICFFFPYVCFKQDSVKLKIKSQMILYLSGAVTKCGTGAWGRGRRDACLGRGTRGREAWDVGTRVWESRWDVGTWGRGDAGEWGRGDAGTRNRGRGVFKIGDARSETRGGEKQKEPFFASNEYKIQFPENQRSLALRGTVKTPVPGRIGVLSCQFGIPLVAESGTDPLEKPT